MFTHEMMKALEADGEKLRQITGENHGPFCVACLGNGGAWRDVWVVDGWSVTFDDCPECLGSGKPTEQQ